MKNICLAIVEILFFHIRWIKFFAQTSSYLWCEIEHSMQFLFPWQLFGLRFEVLSIYCSKNWIRTVRLYVNEIMWFDRLLICCLWIVHAIWAVTLFDFANFFPNFIEVRSGASEASGAENFTYVEKFWYTVRKNIHLHPIFVDFWSCIKICARSRCIFWTHFL